MGIYAKVIADSVSSTGSRLTTVEARFHRFILPEVNTHRAFSRSLASSRAIPAKKLIDQVMTDPAQPIEYGRNQPGMQAGETLDANDTRSASFIWLKARDLAVEQAEKLDAMGVHKQVVNRLLEPFSWSTAIISSTEAGWRNFFSQRISQLAQPEIAQLAAKILYAMDASEPRKVEYSFWHAPYYVAGEGKDTEQGLKISAARCARVSYLTHDGKRDVQKDLELYDKLISADPPHWSPLEHVATPAFIEGTPGNFDGWDQLRHLPEYQ